MRTTHQLKNMRGFSGGLEAASDKGVLGLDGIKVHRMTGGLLYSYPPMQRKQIGDTGKQ